MSETPFIVSQRDADARPALTPHCQIRRVEAVVNEASGSVGDGAAEALEAIVAEHGLAVRVTEARGKEIVTAVEAAVRAQPDLLVTLAGDGTARLAAELAGKDGPLIACLPGGTMNVLPKALYGDRDWREALRAALTEGVERPVSGGCINGQHFFVAAILGSPALWAPAREAMRDGQFSLAAKRALGAWKRAFSGDLRYRLDDGALGRAEAISVLCPLISKAMDEETALEVAVLTPTDAAQAFVLAFKTLWGDWRADSSVQTHPCRKGVAMARGRIPVILDGETVRMGRRLEIEFRRVAFRALAPAGPHPEAIVPGAPVIA